MHERGPMTYIFHCSEYHVITCIRNIYFEIFCVHNPFNHKHILYYVIYCTGGRRHEEKKNTVIIALLYISHEIHNQCKQNALTNAISASKQNTLQYKTLITLDNASKSFNAVAPH